MLHQNWLTALGITCIVGIGASVVYIATNKGQIVTAQMTQPTISQVNALGRLQPAGELIKVSAPTDINNSSRIAELLVEEGQLVKAGDIIAILESRDSAQANLNEGRQQVQVALSKLAQIKAGANPSELAAKQANITNLQAQLEGETQTQQATIARFQAELENAQIEFTRYQTLYQQGAIPATSLDSRRLNLATAQAQLQAAQATLETTQRSLTAQIAAAQAILEQTAEVRPTDVAVSQAELDRAMATLEKMQTQLNLAYIRAPQAGQILKIQTRPGETVGENGILELGETQQMYAIAEIYESDIVKIRPGQDAIITSPSNAFSGKLKGTVDAIGLKVAKKDVLDNDPTAATDARVIEAKIRLDENASEQVARLTNLQVNVQISLTNPDSPNISY